MQRQHPRVYPDILDAVLSKMLAQLMDGEELARFICDTGAQFCVLAIK